MRSLRLKSKARFLMLVSMNFCVTGDYVHLVLEGRQLSRSEAQLEALGQTVLHKAGHGVGDQAEDVHAFVDRLVRLLRAVHRGERLFGERESPLLRDLDFAGVVYRRRAFAELAAQELADDVFHHAQHVEAELVHHLDDDVFRVVLFQTLEDFLLGGQVYAA